MTTSWRVWDLRILEGVGFKGLRVYGSWRVWDLRILEGLGFKDLGGFRVIGFKGLRFKNLGGLRV